MEVDVLDKSHVHHYRSLYTVVYQYPSICFRPHTSHAHRYPLRQPPPTPPPRDRTPPVQPRFELYPTLWDGGWEMGCIMHQLFQF